MVDLKRIKEGEVYVNKNNDQYIHIKEVTKLNNSTAHDFVVVASDKCTVKNDSKTTICRQIITATDFWNIYKEEDDWNLAERVGGEYGRVFDKTAIKLFIQKVKEDINKLIRYHKGEEIIIGNRKLCEIIDKRAGDL